jgi:hypothetical protein
MRFSDAAATTFLFPFLVLGAISTAAWAADEEKYSKTFFGLKKEPTSSEKFFGNILAPCAGDEKLPAGQRKCDALKEDLRKLKAECGNIDEPCPTGVKILEQLYGKKTYRSSLPDFIVYLEQKPKGMFVGDAPPTGVLIWRGNNTPHLYGARDLYALVFSEQKACLEASVAMDFKSEPNPFSGLFAAIGSKADDPKAPASDRKAAPLRWYPLSGDSQRSELWIGVAQLAIEVNSVDRLNIQFAQPKAPSKDAPPDECTAGNAGNADYKANYLAANAFFSNSPDSRVGISFALGMTTNPKSTTVSTGDGANQYFNGYAFAKLYIRQPQLRAAPEVETESLSARRVSYALVLGTNVTKTSFSEIVVGVSAGHILGNMGVILGLNSLAGAPASDNGRKWRPYLGLEYSF